MPQQNPAEPVTKVSLAAAWLAIAAAAAALLLLVSLHVLSPEYDPAWRMVSEYANGHYAWVLSLMFAAWGISSWALALAIWRQDVMRSYRIGLVLLIIAGIGEAAASVLDINNPLHDPAGALGILGLPIAAMLISARLVRTPPWSASKTGILWMANLTWVSVLALAATFALMVATFARTGAPLPTTPPPVLPPGVIGLVGWADRLLVLIYCFWVITIAWQGIKARRVAENVQQKAAA